MKYYLSLLIFFIFINFTFAQDSTQTTKHELKHGIEFQIGTLLNLTNFNSYTFSYRYLFNKKSGVRIGLLTSVNQTDYDITQRLDSLTITPPDYSQNYNYKISFQYLQSILDFKSFSLICGGGPFISYSKSEYHS